MKKVWLYLFFVSVFFVSSFWPNQINTTFACVQNMYDQMVYFWWITSMKALDCDDFWWGPWSSFGWEPAWATSDFSDVIMTKDNTTAYKSISLSSSEIAACKTWGWYALASRSGGMFVKLAACVAQWHIYSAKFYGPYQIWHMDQNAMKCGGTMTSCNSSVILNEDVTYGGKVLYATPNKWVSIEGGAASVNGTPTNFNSPFLYFQNIPKDTKLSLIIDSEKNRYQSLPVFNEPNGWSFSGEGNSLSVDGQNVDHLFYELQVPKVQLGRYGKNFASKNELLDFLKNGDFFERLWFTQVQKENSLNYIIPKIDASKNYYLTLLDDESVANISSYKFSQTPEEMMRRYFVIYPTNLPVSTLWDLHYPTTKTLGQDTFSLQDFWELYVDGTMSVYWK